MSINHKTSLTHARVNLGALVKKVSLKGDRYILEKDGFPVAALVPLSDLKKKRSRK